MEVVNRLSNREAIDRIASENRYELSTQRKLKVGDTITRIIDMWDPTHFIFELLQNADDVEATVVNYYIDDTGVIFTHNGKDFEEKEVEALCSISHSTKNIITQIGFMGMGFKSVFKITDNPQIISEKFRFHFSKEGYNSDNDGWVFIPKWGEILQNNVKFIDGFTNFILPFKTDLDNEVKEDIKIFLNRIEPISIAFLRHITNINIYFNGSLKYKINKKDSSIVFNQNEISFKSFINHISIPDSLKKLEKIKKKERDKVKEVPIILAFLFDKNRKLITQPMPFYAFLPTEEKTGLKFILQTDFILNSKRTSLDKEILQWNTWLIKCAQRILWEAIEFFKLEQNLKYDFYSILPDGSDNKLIKDHFIEHFINEGKNKEFILTSDDQWKKPTEVIWASPDFQNLVNVDDLSKVTNIIGSTQFYVHPKIKIDKSLRSKLNILELDESKEYSIILELVKDEEWLKLKSSKWLNLFYEFLYNRLLNEDQTKRWKEIWTKKTELGKQKIVIDTKGLLQKPFRVLFKPFNENYDNIIGIPDIKFTDIAESSNSTKLLHELGVKSFDAETVIEKILYSYESDKWNEWNDNEKTCSNKFIEAWLIKNKIKNKIDIPKNSIIKREKLGSIRLLCENGKWEKAKVCYIAEEELRKILPYALFLKDSTEYSNEFLNYIGVESNPRIIKRGFHLSSDKDITPQWEMYWNWIRKERVAFGGDKVEVCSIDGFDKAIELENKDSIKIYLKFFINNWEDYKVSLKCKYNYSDKKDYITKDVSSNFAFLLKESKWLPSKDGLVKPTKTVYIPNEQIKKIGEDLLVYLDVDDNLIDKGKDFFKEIGIIIEFTLDTLIPLLNVIKDRAEVGNKIDVSEQSRNQYIEKVKRILSNIYYEIYRKSNLEENSNYKKYAKDFKDLYLLDTNSNFVSVEKLYWNDDFKLGKIFEKEANVKFVWMPANINYQSDLCRFFRIEKITEKVEITVKEPQEKEYDPELTSTLRTKALFLQSLLYSTSKDTKSHTFFNDIEVYTISETEKTYELNSIKKTIVDDLVSCDKKNRKIYIKKGYKYWDLALELTSTFRIDQSNALFIVYILEKPDKEVRDIFEKMNKPIIGTFQPQGKDKEDTIQEEGKKEPQEKPPEISKPPESQEQPPEISKPPESQEQPPEISKPPESQEQPPEISKLPESQEQPPEISKPIDMPPSLPLKVITQQQIRNSELAKWVKKNYGYHCQICLAIEKPEFLSYKKSYSGRISNRKAVMRGHHIKRLGKDKGHDHSGNYLSLCHDHHMLIHRIGFTLEDLQSAINNNQGKFVIEWPNGEKVEWFLITFVTKFKEDVSAIKLVITPIHMQEIKKYIAYLNKDH